MRVIHAILLLGTATGFNLAPNSALAATVVKAAAAAATDQASCSNTAPTSVEVALLQLVVSNDKDVNIAAAREQIAAAAASGATLIVLPEVWNSPYATQAFTEYAEAIPGGPSSAMLVA